MNDPAQVALPQDPEGFRLADLQVDLRTRRVLRAGVDLQITSLSFDLLLALVRGAPGLVTFDALMEQVWPGLVVSPETLTQRVKLLRQALGDSADNPRYILAVRGHGYRLLESAQPLRAEPDQPPPAPVRKRPWRRIVLTAGVLGPVVIVTGWLFSAPVAEPEQSSLAAEAYALFLQAESVVNGTPESFQAAISFYDAALERDPGLARAYSGRAMNRAALVWNGSRLARGLDHAESDARKALQLDETDSRAHAALASIHAMRGRWSASEASFQAAMTESSADPEVLGRYAVTLLLSTGQLRKASQVALQAQSQAANEGFPATALAYVHHVRGEDAQAIAMAELAVARGADPRQLMHVHALAAMRGGRHAEAAELAIRMLSPEVLDAGGAHAIRLACQALSDPSKRPSALAALRKLAMQPAWEHADPRSRQIMVHLLASLGAMDELHHELARMLLRDGNAHPEILAIGMLWAPELRAFRQDRPFQALAQRLGLLDYWRTTGPPDGCALSGSAISCG